MAHQILSSHHVSNISSVLFLCARSIHEGRVLALGMRLIHGSL